MSIKDKFIRYCVRKVKLDQAEEQLLKELEKQLSKNGIKFNRGINKHSIDSLQLTDEGVVFNYSIVDYDESTPAKILLK